MLIILTLYVVALWLVFSKFKWVKFGWVSGTIAGLGGAFILAVFLHSSTIGPHPALSQSYLG